MLRLFWWMAIPAALTYVALALAFAYPQPFFQHRLTEGNLTVRSTSPVPEAARPALRRIEAELGTSLVPYEGQLTIYLVEGGWRARFYFASVPEAGGLTFAGIAPRHMFLRGADIPADRLLRDGVALTPPFTFTYYVLHEANHLALADLIGARAYHDVPTWVREGLADHVALPLPDFDARAAALGDREITAEDQRRFGGYPRKHMLVAWALSEGGFTLDTLLATEWTEQEAVAAFNAGRAQRN